MLFEVDSPPETTASLQTKLDGTYAPVGSVPAQITRTGWYSAPAGTISAAIAAEGLATYLPLFLDVDATVDRIAAQVTVAGSAGAVVRLGIYDSDDDGVPGSLVLDAGTIDGTSPTVQEIVINQALSAGKYWLCGVVQGGAGTRPTMRQVATSGLVGGAAQSASAALGFAMLGAHSGTGAVAGALPSPAVLAGGSSTPMSVSVRFA